MAGVPYNSLPALKDRVKASPAKPQQPSAWPKARSDTYRPDLQFSTHERRRVALGDPYAQSAIEQQDRDRTETPRPPGGGGGSGRR